MTANKLVVSNTQVTSFALCQKQHDYRFNVGIEPKPDLLKPPLYRGILGHEALEAYYTEIMAGSPVETAKKAMRDVLQKELLRISKDCPEDIDKIFIVTKLVNLLDAYVEYYRVEPFRIIAVEKVFQAPIAKNILYSMKLDLLVEHTSGEYRGDLELIDHKFVYNFKDVAELEMDGQMPKYIKTLRENGYIISKARFNQIRHREMKAPRMTDIFQRTKARLHPAKTQTIWNEQQEWAEKIALFGKHDKLRTLSVVSCRGCYFHEICNAEAMGQSVDKLKNARYQPTTYGYTELGADD